MLHMKPPSIPEDPPDILTPAPIDRLLRDCEGRDFIDRRDRAVLMLFADTGMPLAELAHLRVADLDFEFHVAHVVGKGRRPRATRGTPRDRSVTSSTTLDDSSQPSECSASRRASLVHIRLTRVRPSPEHFRPASRSACHLLAPRHSARGAGRPGKHDLADAEVPVIGDVQRTIRS